MRTIKRSLAVFIVSAALIQADAHKAYSFQHHHGPVVGDAIKVVWKDHHGHDDIDYRAHPKYDFHYGVEDHHTDDHKSQKEHRDGHNVVGEYTIHEPGGNLRVVKYHTDSHGGIHMHVHNTGGNDHSGGTYGRDSHHHHHHASHHHDHHDSPHHDHHSSDHYSSGHHYHHSHHDF